MTVHSLGFRTLASHLRRKGVELRVVTNKYRALVRTELGEVALEHAAPEEALASCESYLLELVNYARLTLTDTKRVDAVQALALRYNLTPPEEVELEDEMHLRLRAVLRKGMEAGLEGLIDYTDMIYLPFVLHMAPRRYDFVCIDEAQDYSALALEFTMRLVADGGRLLFVGDPRQSIFGFAGADTDALERIISRTDATVLPLSITYRCPRSHVELAKLLTPEIEARPNAPEGRVFWIHDRALERWVREGDLVICRTNGPLVSTCLRLVRADKRAFVRGRDLSRGLRTMARQVFARGLENPYGKLARFAETEEARLWKALRGRPHAEGVIAQRHDLIDCLGYLVSELFETTLPSLERLERLIARTFGEEGPAVVLSTVHRAKGKEADRVAILYPEGLPASYARTPEAVRGEACVGFVALTRARRDLLFVESPPREDPRGIVEEAFGVNG